MQRVGCVLQGYRGGAGGLWGCPPLDLKGTRGGSAPGAWSGATPLGAGRSPSCWWGALGCRAPTQDTWLAPTSMLCHLPVSSSASLFPGRARPGGFWGPLFGVTPLGPALSLGLGWAGPTAPLVQTAAGWARALPPLPCPGNVALGATRAGLAPSPAAKSLLRPPRHRSARPHRLQRLPRPRFWGIGC